MRAFCAIALSLLLQACLLRPGHEVAFQEDYDGPIIDMHLHALGANDQGPAPMAICVGMVSHAIHDPATSWPKVWSSVQKNPVCDAPFWSPTTDKELLEQSIAALRRLNVVAVVSGPHDRVDEWKKAAPELFIGGFYLAIDRYDFSPADISEKFKAGEFEVLGEIANQYFGIAADDQRFSEYWQVAADLDIPVGIHIGVGPPGAGQMFPNYTAALHSPLALESVLKKHPTLRVYIMHAAWPMREELKAMLYAYPHLYVDTGVLQMALPRAEYHDFLEDLVRSGFGNRIMFGSDQMVWPGLIEEGIDAINEAPFLTRDQKAAILYGNAARFLRLKDQ